MQRHELGEELSKRATSASILLELILLEQLRGANVETLSEAMREPLRTFSRALLLAFDLWKRKVTGSIQISEEEIFDLYMRLVDRHITEAERLVEEAVFIRT